MNLRQLKRDHGIVRAFIQRSKLTGRIRAGSRLADAGLNLSPIAHWAVIVSAERVRNQRYGVKEENAFVNCTLRRTFWQTIRACGRMKR